MALTKTNARMTAGAHVTGWQAEATLKNTRLDYAPLATLVQANIDGQRLAKRFLDGLDGSYVDTDSLYLSIKSILADGQNSETLATLRGFARILQKQLERGAA